MDRKISPVQTCFESRIQWISLISLIRDKVFDFGGKIVFLRIISIQGFSPLPWGIGEKECKKYYATNDPNFYNNDVLFNPMNPVNPDSNLVAAVHKISIKNWTNNLTLSY